MLGLRIGAVLNAQRALADNEHGAHHGLRAALIDLASIAVVLAEDLDGDAELFAEATTPEPYSRWGDR